VNQEQRWAIATADIGEVAAVERHGGVIEHHA
jgi:hypothetical protein